MIFFLHGAVGHSSDWDPIMVALNADQCNAIDIYCYSSEEIDMAARRINSLAKPNDIIVGYSLGARIALESLLADNSPWSKAILISANTGITEAKARDERIQHDRKWSELCNFNWSQFIESWERQSIFDNSKQIADREGLIPKQKEISNTFIKWSSGIQSAPITKLGKIRIPTLWLTGQSDLKYTKIAKHACDLLPLSELKIIENSGHRVPWDNPEKTVDAINVFIS